LVLKAAASRPAPWIDRPWRRYLKGYRDHSHAKIKL
jgi:hypothetical protein